MQQAGSIAPVAGRALTVLAPSSAVPFPLIDNHTQSKPATASQENPCPKLARKSPNSKAALAMAAN